MQREILLTADGSHTITLPEMKVTYHRHHGAIEVRKAMVAAGFSVEKISSQYGKRVMVRVER